MMRRRRVRCRACSPVVASHDCLVDLTRTYSPCAAFHAGKSLEYRSMCYVLSTAFARETSLRIILPCGEAVAFAPEALISKPLRQHGKVIQTWQQPMESRSEDDRMINRFATDTTAIACRTKLQQRVEQDCNRVWNKTANFDFARTQSASTKERKDIQF